MNIPAFVSDQVVQDLATSTFTGIGDHTYLAPGIYEVRTNATSTAAGTANTLGTATIRDTALGVDAGPFIPTLFGTEGTAVSSDTLAAFRDSACSTTASYVIGIDWGDNTGLDLVTGQMHNFSYGPGPSHPRRSRSVGLTCTATTASSTSPSSLPGSERHCRCCAPRSRERRLR